MAVKIFKNAFIIGIVVLVLTCGILIGTMYDYYDDDLMDDLRTSAVYAAHGIAVNGEGYFDGIKTDDIVTWVDEKGNIIYDSTGKTGVIEDAPDVSEALLKGDGIGTGKTAEGNSYMSYSVKLEDGTVLRMAMERDATKAYLQRVIPPVIIVAGIVILLALFLSSRLAGNITREINGLSLDRPDPNASFKELEPLVRRINEQNYTIKKQMTELKRKQQEFSSLTENMSEGFIIIDNCANVLSCNKAALKILDRNEPIRNICQGSVIQEIRDGAQMAMDGKRSELTLNIESTTYELIANPVILKGQNSGAVLLLIDITEREEREALRREFSANVSHELKTPLTSISGFAELMKEGIVPFDKMCEFSGDIYKESRRLISLIDDIINISRLDEKANAPQKEKVDLKSIANEAAEALKPAADNMGVTVSVGGDGGSVYGVRQILWDVVYNLCENAVKYNKEQGLVKINVSENEKSTVLTVEDTGIGIPFSDQNRVFERFYRVDKSHSKEKGGTGLGLSIVKHRVMVLDGEIALSSTPGKGTKITVTFSK